MKKKIELTSKIHCLKCGDIIESKGQHDFVECKCKSCFVDGGDVYYTRYGGNPDEMNVFGKDGKEYKFNSKTQTWDIPYTQADDFIDEFRINLMGGRSSCKKHNKEMYESYMDKLLNDYVNKFIDICLHWIEHSDTVFFNEAIIHKNIEWLRKWFKARKMVLNNDK